MPLGGRVPPNGGWDWPEYRIVKRNAHGLLHFAVWSNHELCALAIGWQGDGAFKLGALEGMPAPGGLLKGRCLAVILEVAACYAQGIGCQELRLLEPANQKLVEYYTNIFGFTFVNKRGEQQYCVRSV